MASRLGCCAVEALISGEKSGVVCAKDGDIFSIDISSALAASKGLNEQQYEVMEAMMGIDD